LIPGSGIEVVKKKIKKLTKKKQMKFLFIGRLLIHKGILEYLHAAEKLSEYNKNLYFNIIGRIDKSNTSSINNFLIKKYQKNEKIKFLGYKENINKYINLSDCIVLPSYREGLPRVILESLILERPVIATNVAGCNQIIKNNYNGFLCKVKKLYFIKKYYFKIY
jgi:glycosyltransferase involved in cell wall biosynthesis